MPSTTDFHLDADIVDPSTSRQIPALLELSATFSSFTEPAALLDAFVKGMARIYGPRCYVELVTTGLRPGEYRIARFRSIDGADLVPARGVWMTSNNPVRTGGLFGQIVAGGKPILAQNLNVPHDPVVANALATYHSMAAVPAIDSNAVNWIVLFHTGQSTFSLDDLEAMIMRVSVVNVMINNMTVRLQLAAANRQIAGEIDRIAAIQRALLPSGDQQKTPGLSVATSYETFDHAGGDMYDLIELGERSGYDGKQPDNRWAILVGDVSGHGPAAAVVMAMYHAMLHGHQYRPSGPGDLLQYANIQLCANPVDHSFITAFLAFYDPGSRTLTYARAGHPPPLLRHADGSITELNDVGDLPLAIFVDTQYQDASLDLQPGQILIFYTDGITESKNPQGEMFGLAGLEKVVRETVGDAADYIQSIRAAVATHQAGRAPDDDQTIMAVQSRAAE